MYRGDRARKENLVNYGFRLPAALDNRPLKFDEFLEKSSHIIHVSATPGKYELEQVNHKYVEQIIRPTGLIDPEITVKPAKNQIDDLLSEINQNTAIGGRTLVTTLTKRMAEDISSYFLDLGISVKYLHSDIDSLERSEILQDLRRGVIDVLIGINLLREGLDLPEVTLVAVTDADKEGFLRSRSSLIQTVGRAARNVKGRVLFYADTITKSMEACIQETNRRRDIQIKYNREHGIIPTTINKEMRPGLREIYGLKSEDGLSATSDPQGTIDSETPRSQKSLEDLIKKKSREMKKAAAELEFEKAAELRDMIARLKERLLVHGEFK